jgi:predicted transport protein
MSKFGFYSETPESISFESHLSGLEENTKALLLELRDFIKSLGSNVIEEVRPHRIVYAKSLNFRTFLDVQPRNDRLIVSIKKSRTENPASHIARSKQELEGLKHEIEETYKTIK